MNLSRLIYLSLFLLASMGWSASSPAADLALKDDDCTRILERWAEDPDSVPRHLVDGCKEQMAAAPVAPAAVAAAAPVDPCTGPNAGSSVLCWGPWSALAPAAEAPLASLEFPTIEIDCATEGDIANQCVAQLEPLSAPPEPPPLEGCTPGASCGFATYVDGLTSSDDVESTSFKRLDMTADGTSFTVDAQGPDEIVSTTMTPTFTNRTDDYENMRTQGAQGDDQSRLVARVIRDDADGDIQLAADVWTQGNRSNSLLNKSGYFAWGNATSQSGLSLLHGNGISLSFSGPMSVNNATNGAMTVNFGSQPSWTGTWTNPAWSFGAGGSVNGVNLYSNPSQFTSNVQAGGVVQGALLGEPGRQAITHIIDVTLDGPGGHIKDVGLLREVTQGPSIGNGISP